ncbi:MAG: signal recognition particle-docking protein FtsY [Thermodesulfobacteriota bacterium]
MEEITSFIDNFNYVVQDIIWVAILFLGVAIISYILTYLFEEKTETEPKEIEVEEPPFDQSSLFKSSVEPTSEISDKATFEDSTPDVDIAVSEEVGVEDEVEQIHEETKQTQEEIIAAREEIEEEPSVIETEKVIEKVTKDEVIVEKEEIIQELKETKEGLFSKLRLGLSKTQVGLLGKLDHILSRKEIDDNLWDDFEETLILADIGVGTTLKLRKEIEEKISKQSLRDPKEIKSALREECIMILKEAEGKPIKIRAKPFVIMIAGVNGVGKTTTIGKIAYKLRNESKTIMVAAADTFRAAAVEQLEIWAKRVGSDFLKAQHGTDPSAVAFDAIKATMARGTDILIIDTAGRLHTKTNLMDELKKINRVIGRELDGAPHETLLVLDATTGQNAIQQAKMFNEAIEISGIILTKLDGTAKGGVILAIADELNIPVKYIGIGESLGDLREFNAEEFVEALFMTGEETFH